MTRCFSPDTMEKTLLNFHRKGRLANMTGTIFNIQKFCINDGPGIRTTVFVKGCPLNCLWCHNPESKSARPELLFDPGKCIACGQCAALCEAGCHQFDHGVHLYDRERCAHCGKCAASCYTGALEAAGYEISVEDALAEVLKDVIFYQTSGGGLTISGGEPMAQFAFTHGLLSAAKAQGLHTCMETCGFAPRERYEAIAPLVDLFLFDYKLTDSRLHQRYTGVPNEPILENLRMLDQMGRETILRCPIIPTVNDTPDHLRGIAETANSLTNLREIHLEPYHPLGAGKAERLGKDYPLKDLTFPEQETVRQWIRTIEKDTQIPVKQA